MSSFDVRQGEVEQIDYIVYSDDCAIILNEHGRPYIKSDDHGDIVTIGSQQEALNLIKAIKKALELGWWKE